MAVIFLYPWVLGAGVLIFALFCILRHVLFSPVTYRMPAVQLFKEHVREVSQSSWRRWIIPALRTSSIFLLILATARPRIPDERSLKTLDGIAIMLVLDVSGSMACYDKPNVPKNRFESAQEEAIRFVNKRQNDMCGLVIFGAAAASRCPLTADKKVLTDIIQQTKLGVIEQDGTALCTAIATAAQRLRSSAARSKIMVVLTDGEPSQEDTVDPHTAIDLAKKLGIKVYTIGIGSEDGGYVRHPLGGWMQVPSSINKKLLYELSMETGGRFFEARYQKELQTIYETINSLETSTHQAPVYAHYFEVAVPLLLMVFILLILEIGITSWFRIVA